MNGPDRLTTGKVKGIQEPGRYGDGRGGHGLSLLVRPLKSGLGKHWQQRVTVKGKVTNIGLSSFPTVSLAQARRQAADNASRLRALFPRKSGLDRLLERHAPDVAAIEPSTGPTFRDVAEDMLETRGGAWKPGTLALRRAHLATYINPVIGDVPIDEVRGSHVLDVLKPLWNVKAATAQKVKVAMSQVYKFASAQEYLGPYMPDFTDRAVLSLGKQRKPAKNHDRVPYTEIHDVLAYIRGSGTYESKRLAFEFLILTAARTGEVRGATWVEFDLDAATWTIPGERMKEGREHRVPLSTAAMDILRQAQQADWQSFKLVFPNPNSGGQLPPGGLRELIRARYKATPHGFRSTFRDWAAEKAPEVPAEIAEHALAHLPGTATIQAYRRTDYFDLRHDLMERWGAYVTAEADKAAERGE